MREIVSPLSGIRSPFGGRVDPYKVLGFKPGLVADFGAEYYRATGRTTFDGLTSFSRASNATMVDSTGTLVTVGPDEPRIGHHVWNGSAWVNEGLLHESEARTNLALYSNEFDNAAWALTNVGIAAPTKTATDAVVSPDGTTNADAISFPAVVSAGNVSTIRQAVVTTAQAYTGSVWLKAYSATDVGKQIGIYINDGTIGSFVFHTLTDSWVRIHVTDDCVATTSYFSVAVLGSDYGGANQDACAVAIYGAQLEQGSTPSSYIPTSGATATRAAETLTAPSANLPWPTPQVIGDELVTNGTFDTDSDWTYTTGWNITGGKLEGVATGGVVEGNTQQLATISGKVYLLTLDVDAVDGNDVIVNVGSSLGSNTLATVGSKSYLFVAAANDETFQVRFSGASTAGDTITIDNISVKEINPLVVCISMKGEMTYADNAVDLEALLFRWQIDTSNRIDARLTTTGSITGQINFRQSSAGVTDAVSSGISYLSPGINVPFNIASRHGSTFINGAVDGTALTEDTTPVALPDLSATDLDIGSDFMGTIKTFRIWADDIGDTGIAEASS